MGNITTSVIAAAIWDCVKKGTKITKNVLKNKLSSWLVDEDTINKIQSSIEQAPAFCLDSEQKIKSYLDLNSELLESLMKFTHGTVINQNATVNEGNMVGVINGDVYYSSEKPQPVRGKSLSIIDDYIKTSKIQIVKSFSLSREEPNLIQSVDGTNCILSKLSIPVLPSKEAFLMTLFSYIPSKNWIDFANAGYSMEFVLELSSNIDFVQLQIKNAKQIQFIDITLKAERQHIIFSKQLTEMAVSQSWKDIGEICFTIFLYNNDIMGQDISCQISNFRLYSPS